MSIRLGNIWKILWGVDSFNGYADRIAGNYLPILGLASCINLMNTWFQDPPALKRW